jgi:transcriptional regulator with XRE-family HTH domain
MITASQCRAARGLLDWTQQELADAARIGVATVRLFESEATETRHATLAVLRRAFELAGVEFANGDQPGVRLTKAAAASSAEPAGASKPAVAAKAVRGKTAKATKKKR